MTQMTCPKRAFQILWLPQGMGRGSHAAPGGSKSDFQRRHWLVMANRINQRTGLPFGQVCCFANNQDSLSGCFRQGPIQSSGANHSAQGNLSPDFLALFLYRMALCHSIGVKVVVPTGSYGHFLFLWATMGAPHN